MLISGMNAIEAEENLNLIQATTIPSMKDSNRRKVVNDLSKRATRHMEHRALTHEDMDRLLNG